MSPTPPDDSGTCYCGLCSLDTIATVAESVVDVSQRRKVLFFIGGYLPLNPEAWGDKDSLCSSYLPSAIRRTLEAAQRANLTIYGLDPLVLIAPAQYSVTDPVRSGRARPTPEAERPVRVDRTIWANRPVRANPRCSAAGAPGRQ